MEVFQQTGFEKSDIKIEKIDDINNVEYDIKHEIFNGVCRGCLGIDNLKNMSQTYYYEGNAEIYSDMLFYCFSIKLEDLQRKNGCKICFICEMCVEKLRDAAHFRSQFETALLKFKNLLDVDEKVTSNDSLPYINISEVMDCHSSANEDLCREDESIASIKRRSKKKSKSSSKTSKRKEIKKTDDTNNCDFIDNIPLSIISNGDRDETDNAPWSRETMKTAVEIVLSGEMSARKAAAEYKIPRSSLLRKVTLMKGGKTVNFSPVIGLFTNTFTKEYENRLVEEIVHLSKRRVTLNRKEFLRIARRLAKSFQIDNKFKIETESAGTNFYYYFMKRHPILRQKSQKQLLSGNMHGITTLEEALKFHKDEAGAQKKVRKKAALPEKINDTDLQCKICNEEFLWNKNLKMHMSVHYPNHVCETCGHLSATRKQLSHHAYSHRPPTISCPLCPDSKFKTSNALQAHTKLKHLGENDRYKCPACGERFTSFTRRRKHLIDAHHHQERKYACKLCRKEFEAAGTLSVHVRIVHLKERNHRCAACQRSFFSKRCLANHMLSHSAERNFPCDVCGKRFKRKTALSEHVKIHTGDKRHVCSVCGRAFTQACTLRGHMAVHRRELQLCPEDPV